MRDVEDEKLWISEKMPLATSNNFGNSLLSVQLLTKKNHVSISFVSSDYRKPTFYTCVILFNQSPKGFRTINIHEKLNFKACHLYA